MKSRLSTIVSLRLSRLNSFPRNSFEWKDSFCCPNVKNQVLTFFERLWNLRNVAKVGHFLKLGWFFATEKNGTTEDGLAEYYTVRQNKCISESFKFLANWFDINFNWTHSISMIAFQGTYVDKLKHNTFVL